MRVINGDFQKSVELLACSDRSKETVCPKFRESHADRARTVEEDRGTPASGSAAACREHSLERPEQRFLVDAELSFARPEAG